MIMRVLLAAVIAGVLAGGVAGAFQIWRVSPLIIAAEVYENQPDTGAPHLIGAPHPHVSESAVSATLASSFAANSIAMMALFWIIFGVSPGWVLNRPNPPAES